MSWIDDVFSADVWGDWGGVWDAAKAIVPIAGAIGGAVMGSNANSNAAGQMLQANQAQADQLQYGYDEQLQARLAGLDGARGLLGERTEIAQAILVAAATKYGGDVRQAASAYAQAMPQLASTISQMYMSGALTGGDMYRAGAATAGAAVQGAAGQYGATVIPAAGQYGQSVIGAAGEFGASMDGAADAYQAMIQEAPELVRQALGPYAEAGLQMLPQLMSVATTDPSRLTQSQQRALEELRRGMGARLAASGLRGAGRAGVAAANEGEAEFMARAFDSNRARSDQAMYALNQQGYGANQLIGAAGERAIYSGADRQFQATQAGAQAMLTSKTDAARTLFAATDASAKLAYSAAQQAAAWGYDAEKAAAQAYINAVDKGTAYSGQALMAAQRILYESGTDVAKSDQQTAYKIADQSNNYYDNMAKWAVNEGDLVGEALMGKRKAEAAAVGPAAVLPSAQAGVSNANLWGNTIASVSRMIADDRASTVRPNSYNNVPTPAGTFDTLPGGQYGDYAYSI